MRILICTGIFPPEKGGPATYSESLATAFVKRGHEVRVITYSSNHESRITNQDFSVIRISRSWFKPWHYLKYYLAVKKYSQDADVLYAQDPVSSGYPTYLANKTLKKPLVVKITGDYSWERAMGEGLTDKLIDEFQNLKDYPSKVKKIRKIQIRVCQAADRIITPSEYLKRIVSGWGVDEKKLKVIYNAVTAVPEIPKDQACRELGIAESDFLILSVGRNVPWKGFKLVKEVVDEISQSVIPRLDRGIQSKFKLVILHDADRETSDKYFRAADIFVLNTGYEGFSHTILEAMSAGVPVITTNVGGNPEVISYPLSFPPYEGEIEGGSNANGILIEYNNKQQLRDTILKLYNDPALRQRLIKSAQFSLSKFSFDSILTQTEEILTQISLL